MGYVIYSEGNLVGTGFFDDTKAKEVEANGIKLVTINEYLKAKAKTNRR